MEYQGRSHLIRSVSAVLALAVSATGAYAQDSGETQVGGIEEVIVTARKRAESVQDVPVLVTAVSAEQIRERDLTSLDKVAAATPNLNVGRASNGSGAQITLRGIGTSPTSIGIEQSVATVVDSVYYGQGRIINEGFFDAQRIEVLKGPQALFYGKNATAGVISITTNDRGDEPEALARLGERFFRGAAGAASGSGLGWSIAQRIAAAHGARLQAQPSAALGGLGVTLSWPAGST